MPQQHLGSIHEEGTLVRPYAGNGHAAVEDVA